MSIPQLTCIPMECLVLDDPYVPSSFHLLLLVLPLGPQSHHHPCKVTPRHHQHGYPPFAPIIRSELDGFESFEVICCRVVSRKQGPVYTQLRVLRNTQCVKGLVGRKPDYGCTKLCPPFAVRNFCFFIGVDLLRLLIRLEGLSSE